MKACGVIAIRKACIIKVFQIDNESQGFSNENWTETGPSTTDEEL